MAVSVTVPVYYIVNEKVGAERGGDVDDPLRLDSRRIHAETLARVRRELSSLAKRSHAAAGEMTARPYSSSDTVIVIVKNQNSSIIVVHTMPRPQLSKPCVVVKHVGTVPLRTVVPILIAADFFFFFCT